MPLTLYNTLTRRREEFAPADPSRVSFYTCGPTVYDDAHVGNFRSFLAADVLRRWVESEWCVVRGPGGEAHAGPRRVVHVMNITDVGHMTDDAEGGEAGEDRMAVAGRRLAEAKKSGALPDGVTIDPRDPYSIAAFYAQRFLEDARRLGLKVALEQREDPTLMPFATAHVPGMIEVIKALLARGHAYVVGGGGGGVPRAVYFRVRSFEPYGRLSGNTLDQLREGEGGRVSTSNQASKEHPADFLLWKEDPSHIMKWPSPWGEGYPGWHIECTVMAAGRLMPGGLAQALSLPGAASAQIDLHSGGEDNIFPHHECEIAQSACAFCANPAAGTFARMWFHPRHLFIEGQKMSKSKGNFYTARELFAKGHEPAAVRLELIKTHYRSNANFTLQGLADSQRIVERWRRVAAGAGPNPGGAGARDEAGLRFADALHDDLNIAGAIAAVNTFVSRVDRPGREDAELMGRFDEVLGVLGLERPQAVSTGLALYLPGVTPNDQVEALLAERTAAKAAKDFTRSDAIRAQLASMGYAIKDVAGGRVEVGRGG